MLVQVTKSITARNLTFWKFSKKLLQVTDPIIVEILWEIHFPSDTSALKNLG